MFLKRCSRRKCGKDHVYWQLAESRRTPRGSRHRVVGYLRGPSRRERRGRAVLAARLDGRAASKARRMSLFEPPCDRDQERPGSEDDPVPDTVQVKTKDVHVEGTRDFGDVFLPTAAPSTAGRDVKLTCITRPDEAQGAIIERLGIELPERVGRPRWVPAPERVRRKLVQTVRPERLESAHRGGIDLKLTNLG